MPGKRDESACRLHQLRVGRMYGGDVARLKVLDDCLVSQVQQCVALLFREFHKQNSC